MSLETLVMPGPLFADTQNEGEGVLKERIQTSRVHSRGRRRRLRRDPPERADRAMSILPGLRLAGGGPDRRSASGRPLHLARTASADLAPTSTQTPKGPTGGLIAEAIAGMS
jgi:hypothetical protein